MIISDVSGKGIPASLFMMKGKELIKTHLNTSVSLSETIKKVNEILCENNQESLFITSFVGVINFEKEEIRFVNAGHEKPYIISNGKIHKLDGASNFVLGGINDVDYVEEKYPFHQEDVIFMFTDGLNESINDKEEEFGYQRIEENLNHFNGEDLKEYTSGMIESLSIFTDKQEAFDDVTILVAKPNTKLLNLSFDKKDPSIIEETVNTFNASFSYLNDEIKSRAGIILDELLNNLISYEKREDLLVNIIFKNHKTGLTIEISSNGENYNPFQENKEKYLEEFSDDIAEGGFGVLLVKKMAKKYSYSYKNNKSIITIEL